MDTKLFRDMSYGLFVLGVMTPEGKPTGCTVNTVFQLTSDPPMLAVSVNHQNYTNEILKKTGRVAVSVLNQDVDISIIGTFGFRSGREVDKFSGDVPYTVLRSGLPVLTKGVCGNFVCKVADYKDLSTHTLFFCEIEEAWRTGMGKVPPMTYAYYHQVKNGTEPPTAPTYIPPEKAAVKGGDVWYCPLCKYEYDGEVPFDELPEDWTCPICGQPKSIFKKK